MYKRIIVLLYVAVLTQIGLSSDILFSASEMPIESCIETSLSSPRTEVTEGYEIQVNLEYKSNDLTCSTADLTGKKIEVDFSPLVNSDSAIDYSLNQDIFDVEISPLGIVTLTFKDLTHESETLVNFGGNVVFTLTAKEIDANQPITITDNVGGEFTVNLVDELDTGANTNKGSFAEYAQVGDVVTYQVLINGQANVVDTFHGVDSHSLGVEYVDGTLTAQHDKVWVNMDEYFTYDYDADGNMIIDNTMPFDVPVLLTYDMLVTDPEELYHNSFTATYDGSSETVGDDVWYQMEGDSWLDYTHGNIIINNQDLAGKKISGAQFEILDDSNNILDEISIKDSGSATSVDLPLGDYVIRETSPPSGYKLNTEEFKVTIDNSKVDMLFVLTVQNEALTGTININKIDNNRDPLSGAEFDIKTSSGEKVEHVITNEDGTATSTNLPIGEYVVSETKPVKNYLIDDTEYKVTISAGSLVSNITSIGQKQKTENTLDPVIEEENNQNFIEIQLTNSKGSPLANVSFGIYDEDGNLVDVIVTDENGNAKSSYLSPGSYYIQQLDSVDGYVLNNEKYWFNIGSNNTATKYKVVNEAISGQVVVSNVSSIGNAIVGSTFKLYDNNGNLIETRTTDDNGILKFSSLAEGNYYIEQSSVADEYISNEQKYYFTIESNDQVVNLEIINQLIGAKELTKTGSLNYLSSLIMSVIVIVLYVLKTGVYRTKRLLIFKEIHVNKS